MAALFFIGRPWRAWVLVAIAVAMLTPFAVVPAAGATPDGMNPAAAMPGMHCHESHAGQTGTPPHLCCTHLGCACAAIPACTNPPAPAGMGRAAGVAPVRMAAAAKVPRGLSSSLFRPPIAAV